MALSDEWRNVIKATYGEEREIAEHDTVKRSHAAKLKDFRPDIEAALRQGPCVVCGGTRGRADVICETCEREGM